MHHSQVNSQHCSRCPLCVMQKRLEVLEIVVESIAIGCSWPQKIAVINLCLGSASRKEARVPCFWKAWFWLAWGNRENRRDFWARGKGQNCCFMRVMLRAVTVNSKLASDVGRQEGMVTILVVKWPSQCQPQCIEESTVVVGFSCCCWGEPGCIRVLCSCPLPLAVAGATECFTESGNCQAIGRAVFAAPHIEQVTLSYGSSALVRPGGMTHFWKALCTEVLRPNAACCWLSQLLYEKTCSLSRG